MKSLTDQCLEINNISEHTLYLEAHRNEFFKPKEPAILKWLQDQGMTNNDLTTASAELKAKEELQKAVVYESFERKESTKVPSKLGAYEFVEPKESAEVDSETKANLRAKFEVNQINRGVLTINK